MNSAHGFTEGADVPQDNTAPEAKDTITEEDEKAIKEFVGTLQGRLAHDPLFAAEWGIQYARQEVAELRKENEQEKADAQKWYKKYNDMSAMAFNSANKASDQAETIKRLTEALEKCRGLLERYHDSGMQDHRQTEMLIEIQSALSGTKETE